MTDIYGNGIALTGKVLDNLWARQTVTLNNIANVDTPGFKSQYITFEEELRKKISHADNRSNAREKVYQSIQSSDARVQTTWGESSRLDGNNVDMDQEQVDLVRAVFEYQSMANSISNDLNRLRSAAKSF
ncbi:flagellar basal body rod protein FlgB [Hungatella hathewayi]|uniref:flagellar basal body rod protein FlgB n=1 Tax=Hungatella hathewayi TaxID=154046 RepID=UPI00356505AA